MKFKTKIYLSDPLLGVDPLLVGYVRTYSATGTSTLLLHSVQRIFTNSNFRICNQAHFSPRGEKRDRNLSTGAGQAAALFFLAYLRQGW